VPTYYEFFAGAGLVRLGLDPAWTCVWANDNDPRKRAIYEGRFGGVEFVFDDVANVRAETLPPKVDMAWASFPCQDLSLAGWRRGMAAGRSGTFWAFWRTMRDLATVGDRPPIIVIENVTGLLYGDSFSGLCEALAALGMQFGALVIDARYFVPQSRERVFVVAVDAQVDCTALTMPYTPRSEWYPSSLHRALAHLPESICPLWRRWHLRMPSAPVKPLIDLIEEEPTGVKWNTHEQTNRLLEMMTPLNLAKVNAALAISTPAIGLLYKRIRNNIQRAEVRFDGVSGCLRTPKGGSSRQTVLVIRNGEVRSRLLSPREAARLMGVGDDYPLCGGYNDNYRAMGDGVAVPVVAHLSEHLLLPLHERCANALVPIRGGGAALKNGHLENALQASEARAVQWRAAPPR
jgi:DNA (cytosine-5)-methyltransferase 1